MSLVWLLLLLLLQRLERGENVEDDDVFGRGSGEARDDISSLPKKVAVKVISFFSSILYFFKFMGIGHQKLVVEVTCLSVHRASVLCRRMYVQTYVSSCAP